MERETLRLFNAIQIDPILAEKEIPEYILKRTIANGYIIEKGVGYDDASLSTIESIVGLSGKKANSAFHKSWKIIRDSSIEELVFQQILHYFTTYGLKAIGAFHSSTVYVPYEIIGIPKGNVPITYVRALNSAQILSKIIDLASGVALAQETIDDIMVVIKENNYDPILAEDVKNHELSSLLHDHYGTVPRDPMDFLRFVIAKMTGQALVIKNKYLIEQIVGSGGLFVGEDDRTIDDLLVLAPKDLASVFLRFKPLFLAMKKVSANKRFFNRLKKDAVRAKNPMHRPMKSDFLGSVTQQIKEGKSLGKLTDKLKDASPFRKIRLAYALQSRLNYISSIVYRVRNGRSWATDFEWPEKLKPMTHTAFDITVGSIKDDVARNVAGKTYYIPENVHYALPSSEKQFTGNSPSGTYVSVPDDLVFGVYWENAKGRMTDLDLAIIDLNGKIGWDSAYRNEGGKALFSGDLTDATNGATEMFYLEEIDSPYLVTLNYYNYSEDHPVDMKIFAARRGQKDFEKKYMVDPNLIVLSENTVIKEKQSIVALIGNFGGEKRMYFFQTAIGQNISSGADETSTHVRKYLISSVVNSINLNTIIADAGAKIIDKKPEDDLEYVDLSPEALDKSTILKLFQA